MPKLELDVTNEQWVKLRESLCPRGEDSITDEKDGPKEGYEAFFPINLTNRKLRITLPYRSSQRPYSASKKHFGLDISPFPGAVGKPVFSILAGTVIRKVYQNRGYGNYLTVESQCPKSIIVDDIEGANIHIGAGEVIWILYAHLNEITSHVKSGDVVQAGMLIGTIGNTGYSFGPHLHSEIRYGEYDDRETINPRTFLKHLIRKGQDEKEWSFISK